MAILLNTAENEVNPFPSEEECSGCVRGRSDDVEASILTTPFGARARDAVKVYDDTAADGTIKAYCSGHDWLIKD